MSTQISPARILYNTLLQKQTKQKRTKTKGGTKMNQPHLSVIIPCYNEEATIAQTINEVIKETHDGLINITISKQIIIVNDGSTDNPTKIIDTFKHHPNITIIHKPNRGKGSAVKAAIPHCTGIYTVIQDADLEYRPSDYPLLLYPASKNFKAIFGSRRINPHNTCNKSSHLTYYLGGNILTWFANKLYGQRLTDAWTGYKCIETKLLKELNLQSNGFEICAETIAALSKKKIHIFEVPIFYYPRKISAGKKIKWKDGVKLAMCLIQQKWFNEKTKK